MQLLERLELQSHPPEQMPEQNPVESILGEEKVLMVGNIIEQAMKEIIENKKPKVW